jgi:hypothetical protein
MVHTSPPTEDAKYLAWYLKPTWVAQYARNPERIRYVRLDILTLSKPCRADPLSEAKEFEQMDSSHVATGTITALLATALVYLSKWPLQPLDLPTASALAGLLVAAGGALVKLYKSRTAPVVAPVAPVVSIAPANVAHEPPIAA